MVIVSFSGFEVIQLFSEGGGGVGGGLSPGLNRVKGRLSSKPLNFRRSTWGLFSKETGDEPSQTEE